MNFGSYVEYVKFKIHTSESKLMEYKPVAKNILAILNSFQGFAGLFCSFGGGGSSPDVNNRSKLRLVCFRGQKTSLFLGVNHDLWTNDTPSLSSNSTP